MLILTQPDADLTLLDARYTIDPTLLSVVVCVATTASDAVESAIRTTAAGSPSNCCWHTGIKTTVDHFLPFTGNRSAETVYESAVRNLRSSRTGCGLLQQLAPIKT